MGFLSAVLPQEGRYALFVLDKRQHVWVDTIEQLEQEIHSRAERTDVYFATAAFDHSGRRRQENTRALRALRLDIDAGPDKHARDPAGTYPSQGDALAALVAFCRDAALPPSWVVSSGAGLHVYWGLTEDISPAAWLPLAQRLGFCAAQHGLRADPACTSDSARVLRPPGTLHHSGATVAVLKATGRVWAIAELDAILPQRTCHAALPVDQAFAAASEYATLDVDQINAAAGVVRGPLKSLKKLLPRCAAMADAALARGNVAEPYWRAMLGVIRHCVEGDAAAHRLSSGHPQYDPAQTQEKLDRWATGPTTCAEFARHSTRCASCQYSGKVKSPILLGEMTPEEEAAQAPTEQPQAPAHPDVGLDGFGPIDTPAMQPLAPHPWDGLLPKSVVAEPGTGMSVKVKVPKASATGEIVEVELNVTFSRDIFWLEGWTEASATSDEADATLCALQCGHERRWGMGQALIASKQKLLEYLAGKAIHPTGHAMAPKLIQDYMREQMSMIKANRQRYKVQRQFGLRYDRDGRLMAAHGGFVIRADGTIERAALGIELDGHASEFPIAPLPPSDTGLWDKAVWADHIVPAAARHVGFLNKWYGAPEMASYRLAIAMSMASPFMAFSTSGFFPGQSLPPVGLSVTLYSQDPARGKSSAMRAAMMAYADPDKAVRDRNAASATEVSRISRLSLSGTLPVAMDEVGDIHDPMAMSRLVRAVANGSGRERSTREGGLLHGAPWALVVLMAGNRSQRDLVAMGGTDSSAEQYRLLELDVTGLKARTPQERAEYDADMSAVQRDCTGALGALVQYMICAVGPTKVFEAVKSRSSEVDLATDGNESARFQWRAMGATLTMLRMLRRLGLELFDEHDLLDTFARAYRRSMEYINGNLTSTSPVEQINDFLSAIKPQTLITERQTHRGGGTAAYDQPLNARVPDRVVARHIVSEGVTYFASSALTEWCSKTHINRLRLLRDLRAAGVLLSFVPGDVPDRGTYDLHKGTRESTATRVWCLKVDVDRIAAAQSPLREPVDYADGALPPPTTPDLPTIDRAALSARRKRNAA